MKKITCLLSLLLLCAGAMKATAQGLLDRSGWTVTTSGECDDSGTGHAAAITDGNTGTFWHSRWNGAGNASGDNSFTLPQFFQVDLGSEQTFQTIAYLPREHGGANGDATAYKVYVSNTPFVSYDSEGKIVYGSTVGVDNNAASIVNNLSASDLYIDGTVNYSGFTKQTYIINSGAAATTSRYLLFVVTSSGGDNPNNFANCAEFQLINGSVTDAENILLPINVTYKYYIDGNLYTSVTVEQDRNSAVSVPSMRTVNVLSTEGSIGTSDCDITVNCSENLPFQVTTDLSNPKWYAVSIHENQGFFLWQYSAVDANVATTKHDNGNSDYTVANDDSQLWCFMGNLIDGFKIYNKAAGTGYTLNTTPTTSSVGTATGNNDLWDFYPTSASSIANSYSFCIHGQTSGDRYINRQGNVLKYWKATDEGSSVLFHEPASFPVNYVSGYINAPANAVGQSNYLTGENMTNAQAKLAAAQADGLNIDAARELATVAENVANGTFVAMAPGYYRMKNVNYGTYVVNGSSTETYNNVFGGEAAANVPSLVGSVVNFATNGDNYTLYIQGKALGQCKISAPVMLGTETNGVYSVTNNGVICVIGDQSHSDGYNYLHNAASQSNKVVGWVSNAGASQWYLIPATDLEVALTTVDGASYASAYLPFPVQGEGIYTGAINGTSLNMTAQTGVVPAETGIVIKGAKDAASTTLTIGGTADADVSSNSLTGTLTALTADLTNYLVLGKNASNQIGFYTPSNTVSAIAANKAYLLAEEVPSASPAIAMNFGGEATGVGTVITENGIQSNAPVFDLSGRRVMQTVKGGLYIQNGQKFIVK